MMTKQFKKDPVAALNRLIAAEYAYKIGATRIYEASNDFLRTEFFFVEELEDLGQEETHKVSFDWEFFLFRATDNQIDKLLTPVEEEVKTLLMLEAKAEVEQLTNAPTSVNIMDIAARKIKESKEVGAKPELIV